MAKITINDMPVTCEPDTSILKACRQVAIDVPVFCYHDRLAVAGNCRMCLVEVEGINKPVASCATPIADGMVVHTQSPMVVAARENVLEFLLINHPLDCPVCDQGGRCDLQDFTQIHGHGSGRFHLNKRLVPDKYMGPFIKTVMNRCIHCTRCVRFANDIAGIPEIGVIHRGEWSEITSLDKMITSELSGNIIDLCPVGALTSKPNAFQGRPWEIMSHSTYDLLDGVGASINIHTHHGNGQLMGVYPVLNEAVNQEWMTDKTRFGYDGLFVQRIDTPYKRDNGALVPCTWEDAFGLITTKLTLPQQKIAALAGDQVDLEATYCLKQVMDHLQSPHYDCRQNGAHYHHHERAHYLFNTTLQGIDESDCILMIGSNPRVEAPLLNARIRAQHMKGVPIFYHGTPVDLTYPYTHLGEAPPALMNLKNHPNVTHALQTAQKPMIILGQAVFTRPDTKAILAAIDQLMTQYPTFTQENWHGYNVLQTCIGRTGALDVGFTPGPQGMATREILAAACEGALDTLILYGADELNAYDFHPHTFVIYIGHHGDKGAHSATVVLPSVTGFEKNALYVTTEGRLIETSPIFQKPGVAREDVGIMTEIGKGLGVSLPSNIREALLKQHPFLTAAIPNTLQTFTSRKADGTIDPTPFHYPIENFYMTCPITRHSAAMAQASTEKKHFMETGVIRAP